MTYSLRPRARQDVLNQVRYYLDQGSPATAERFASAVLFSFDTVCAHPAIGQRKETANSALKDLRSWPVKGFESIRIYYLHSEATMRIVRVLHSRQDVDVLLRRDRAPY